MTMTSDDVIAVLGPADKTLVAEVAATGVSQAELAEALAWASNDDALISESRHLPIGWAAVFIDLLAVGGEEHDE